VKQFADIISVVCMSVWHTLSMYLFVVRLLELNYSILKEWLV